MKRKRHQIEEENFCSSNNNNNDGKKFKLADEDLEELDPNDADTSADETKEEFILTPELADNAILTDITGKQWRIGAPAGKGSFGEIFLASADVSRAVDSSSARYVTKIEPHSNGPLFVEIHCLLNVNKRNAGESVLLSVIERAIRCCSNVR